MHNYVLVYCYFLLTFFLLGDDSAGRRSILAIIFMRKKRVTAGEVDMWGKELGKCTHQRTTNEEKNKQGLSTLSFFFRLKKKDRQHKKEERSREEDRRGEGNQTPPTKQPPEFGCLLLSSFCCCLSFFFNLKKTLSVESACLYFSSFVVHWLVHFPSSFPHVSASPAVTRFFF